jgi:protease I
MIFMVAANGVQDEEYLYPYYRVQEEQELLCFGSGKLSQDDKGWYVKGKYGVPCRVEDSTGYIHKYGIPDALIIPGGLESPEIMRQDKHVLNLVKEMYKLGKPIGAICHGPQVLISAGIIRGYEATCFWGMKDDLINAGATYVEGPLVVDRNIITSPHYKHNTAFVKAVLEMVKWNNV